MAGKHENDYTLYAHKAPKSPLAEAYRTLRTNLNFAEMDQAYRSILISSVNPQDGKSITAANLAVVLAQTGTKVILVDCDLRKPIQHKIFQVGNEKGITNCLAQNIEVEEVVQEVEIENLNILTSGPIPPNPAEMLGSERAKALWLLLLEKYDYVIIDAPPILAVADASILAAQVDGVVMVINSGDTRIDLAREAKEQLQKASAHLIGVILNKVKMNSSDYQYYYYYSQDSSDKQTGIKF